MTHWLIHPSLQGSGGHCRFTSHTGIWTGASRCGEGRGDAELLEVLPIGGERDLIWDPCWHLFQRGINYTRANSSLVGAPLASVGLSWGGFCCYFEGGLCAISFFLLLLGLGSFLFFGIFGWPGLLAHVRSGSQTVSSSQRCVCLYEPLQSCCTIFWPG